MSAFTQFQSFSRIHDTRKLYVLERSVVWDIGRAGSGWQLYMREGTTFDISVPRLLEWLLNPHDRNILLAALVHDELLREGHDKAFASAEFRRAALARGASQIKSWFLFFATLIWTVLSHGKPQ